MNKKSLAIATIENVDNPDESCLVELLVEERVRMALDLFWCHETELGRQRKSAASRNKNKGGLPVTSKRGRSVSLIAVKVGMRATSFQSARLVVETADNLKKMGRDQDSARLLHLLNNVSINKAKQERDRLERQLDEERLQEQEIRDSLI